MTELTQIGYSSKSRGIDGQFKVRVEDRYKEDLLKARAVFINIDGSKVPFIIESTEERKDVILKLEEVESPEQVTAFLNREIYLSDDEISEDNHGPDLNKHPLIGYMLTDQNETQLGIIEDIIEYPHQLLASLTYNDKPLLVPIHEDLIMSLDEGGGSVQLEIAAGLLDL